MEGGPGSGMAGLSMWRYWSMWFSMISRGPGGIPTSRSELQQGKGWVGVSFSQAGKVERCVPKLARG